MLIEITDKCSVSSQFIENIYLMSITIVKLYTRKHVEELHRHAFPIIIAQCI
jgi:hypothetical protein